jgi:hypothetical protein
MNLMVIQDLFVTFQLSDPLNYDGQKYKQTLSRCKKTGHHSRFEQKPFILNSTKVKKRPSVDLKPTNPSNETNLQPYFKSSLTTN